MVLLWELQSDLMSLIKGKSRGPAISRSKSMERIVNPTDEASLAV